MKNKKTFIEEIEKETLQPRYIREDIDTATQRGRLEGKEFYKKKVLEILSKANYEYDKAFIPDWIYKEIEKL